MIFLVIYDDAFAIACVYRENKYQRNSFHVSFNKEKKTKTSKAFKKSKKYTGALYALDKRDCCLPFFEFLF